MKNKSTSNNSMGIEAEMDKIPNISFAHQFVYHLKDVPIENYDYRLVPNGFVNVHLPNITSIRVPFHPLMDMEQFRNHLQKVLDSTINESSLSSSNYYDCNNFHLVTSKGIIDEDSTLDASSIKEGTIILMISKGISTAEIIKQRNYWLKKREKRLSSPNTPRKERTPEQLIKIRKTLSKRSRFGSKYSFKWI